MHSLLKRYKARGEAVRLGGAWMIETTRKTSVEALREALEQSGGELLSITKETRAIDGVRKKTSTVYTIIACLPD